MSSKKTRKAAATRSNANALNLVSKLEKDFKQTPSILAAHINKEISTQKQAQIKIKTSIKKLEPTKNSANKARAASALKTINNLNKQLQETSKKLATALTTQAKYTALSKNLTQFERDWSKKAKEMMAKAISSITPKATAKTKVKARAKKTATSTTMTAPQNMHQSHETFEQTTDHVNLSDTSEMTS